MKKIALKFALTAFVAGISFPLAAQATEADLQLKVDKLTKEVNDLKGSVKKVESKSIGKWLTIGGEYRFRVDSLRGETATYTDVMGTFANAQTALQGDFFANPSTVAGSSTYFGAPQAGSMSTAGALTALSTFKNNMNGATNYNSARTFVTNPMNGGLIQGIGGFADQVPAYKPKNETLYTNKFSLDLAAKPIKDISVYAKLDMYKTFGSQTADAVTGNYFADRVGIFDGTQGHVPSDSLLNVDRVYATWSNIADQPIWFSVGRRPSTNGAPSHLKLDKERPGNGGTPALLVDYAFDGMTIGYAPDIDALPGAYGKICYGRGFDSGIKTPMNSIKDTDLMGVAIVPYDTDPLRIALQWDRGFNIFDFPQMENSTFGPTAPAVNLGDIDWYGVGLISTLKNVGPGSLQLFSDFGMSVTHPNDNVSANAGFQGLMTGGFFAPEAPSSKTGWAVYAGFRYDLPSKTKIGFEFNHGSKDWITFSPAADDMWTSKVGTRGNVFEPYIIQELNLKPISAHLAKAFFRLGYQYYDFEYTGSNNWVGAPVKISDINSSNNLMMLAPVKTAQDIYATFEVHF